MHQDNECSIPLVSWKFFDTFYHYYFILVHSVQCSILLFYLILVWSLIQFYYYLYLFVIEYTVGSKLDLLLFFLNTTFLFAFN